MVVADTVADKAVVDTVVEATAEEVTEVDTVEVLPSADLLPPRALPLGGRCSTFGRCAGRSG